MLIRCVGAPALALLIFATGLAPRSCSVYVALATFSVMVMLWLLTTKHYDTQQDTVLRSVDKLRSINAVLTDEQQLRQQRQDRHREDCAA